MSTQTNINIKKLGDSDLTLADESEDIRGRKVIDSAGEEVGDVEDLMIDVDEAKVRFLQVGSGGFLGIGEKTFMVPVDAITRLDNDHVHIDRSREHVAGGPDYNPSLVREDDVGFWEDTYTHYGYGPFWAPGYTYPAYPYYGATPPGRPNDRYGL